MALKFQKLSEQQIAGMTNTLPVILSTIGQGELVSTMALGEDASPLVSDAHPVYSMTLQNLLENKGLQSAKLMSYRIFVHAPERAKQFAVELSSESEFSVKSINDGQFVAASLDGIKIALDEPLFKTGTFEVRFLLIPAIYVAALWLADSNKDWILPLLPSKGSKLENKWYEPEELFASLRNRAKERMQRENELYPPA